MKVTDLWSSNSKPTVSFELFPARSEKAAANLVKALDQLAALKPDFVSVTFGAGGSTKEGSRQLIENLINEKKLDVIAYFAGFGLAPDEITETLDRYQSIGVANVLIVRGDPPHGMDDFQPHPDSFKYASDLMKFVRPKYPNLCMGVAGYPEGHNECVSKDKDLEYLKMKVDNGAEYIIANYFYDNKFYFDYVDRCRKAGIDVPIIPGVMPVYSVKMMENLAKLCGATITDELREGINKLPEGDKQALNDFGVEFALKSCRGLIEAGVPGLHIYTMDRSSSTVALVNRLREEGLL
jgi:methylenetetrahydrofolate reductase (NADPH)